MKPEITIRQVRPKGEKVTALLGDGYPTESAPSGWGIVARPKRKGLTTWAGQDPATLTVPILLDGYADNRSVERDINTLRSMMRFRTKRGETPLVKIAGPVPRTRNEWVLADIQYGEEIRRQKDGRRVRAFMQLTFLEYVPGDVMVKDKSPAKAAQDRQKTKKGEPSKASGKTYRIKSGDTLSRIAVRFLGDAGRWREIARLNNIRDPRRLKVGAKIRIPGK